MSFFNQLVETGIETTNLKNAFLNNRHTNFIQSL